jgi:hypothetical protein
MKLKSILTSFLYLKKKLDVQRTIKRSANFYLKHYQHDNYFMERKEKQFQVVHIDICGVINSAIINL